MTALAAESFGPIRHVATPDGVAAFIEATGDDPRRWADHAPPGYAAAGLIGAAAPLLDRALSDFGAVVHTRQRFEYEGPLAVGAEVELIGRVTSIRERAGMTLVDFATSAPGWMTSTSSFLMTASAAAEIDELDEPEPHARSDTGAPTALSVPGPGEQVSPLAKSASRLDVVKYAAASGDWNPIHWDHGSAVAAGLGGVVAHGLLAASWVAQAASRYSTRPDPLASLDIRFRRLLRPAVAATIGGSVKKLAPLVLELSVVAGDDTLVTATVEVNE